MDTDTSKVRKYFVQASFIGRHFSGYQSQGPLNKTLLTVQDAIESCLLSAFHQSVTAVGCSRTDAGVNAGMFGFHFCLEPQVYSCLENSLLNNHLLMLEYINRHQSSPYLKFNRILQVALPFHA